VCVCVCVCVCVWKKRKWVLKARKMVHWDKVLDRERSGIAGNVDRDYSVSFVREG